MSWWVLDIAAKVEAGEDVPEHVAQGALTDARAARRVMEAQEVAGLRGVPHSPLWPEHQPQLPDATLVQVRRAEAVLLPLCDVLERLLQERKFQRPKMTLFDPTDPISKPGKAAPRKPGPKPDPRITAAAEQARAAIEKGEHDKRALMDAALAHGVCYDSVRTRLRRAGQLVNSN
jgi:hypothetical protein